MDEKTKNIDAISGKIEFLQSSTAVVDAGQVYDPPAGRISVITVTSTNTNTDHQSNLSLIKINQHLSGKNPPFPGDTSTKRMEKI